MLELGYFCANNISLSYSIYLSSFKASNAYTRFISLYASRLASIGFKHVLVKLKLFHTIIL